MQNRSLWLIHNPASANGRTAKTAPRVARALEDAGYTVESVATAGPGMAAGQVREALTAGVATLAVLGGDGTLHDVVNGFVTDGRATHPDARLIVLNSGTGGDFGRSLDLRRDPLDGVRALAQARPVTVDLGLLTCAGFDGRPRTEAFINIADVGLAGDVVSQVNRTTKAFGGFVSFLIGTLVSVAKAEPKNLILEVDGGPPEAGRFVNVSIANGRYFGGGMAICPKADPTDGFLDLVTLGDYSRREMYGRFAHIYKGTHLTLTGIQHRRCTSVRITAPQPAWVEADGELLGTTALSVSLLPRALTLLV
jgi:diacylglycerol kinase (ATP)